MIPSDHIHLPLNAAKGCVELGRCHVEQTSQPGMADPTLVVIKRPFAAVANWAEHLYRGPKLNFSIKEGELQMEKYLR